MNKTKVKLAIFASGAGSNAEKIIQYFSSHSQISVTLVVCNNPNAGVLEIARRNAIPVLLINRQKFFKEDGYYSELKDAGIDYLILAGFLWKIPKMLIDHYPGRILNIHPALLPKYGGKGMYGNYVHESVINSGEKESGITVHIVDEIYDNGRNIFQAVCPVMEQDTPETLAMRIHTLEHAHFARVIEEFILEDLKK